jgi:hypothetical protein
MSLYDKGEPFKTQEYRDKTFQLSSMQNVTQVPKLAYCAVCDKRRTEATGEWKDGSFYCGRHK